MRRPQDLARVPAADDDQPRRVDPEAAEPRPVKPPLTPGERCILAPHERSRPAQEAAGQGGGEAGSNAAPDLVQPAERQAAPGQGRVDVRMAERGHGSARARPAALQGANAGTQGRKGRRIRQGSSFPKLFS